MIEFLRSFRAGPFAIFDFVASYILVYFLAPYLSRFFAMFRIRVSREQWLWLVLPISLIFHLVFGKNTPLTKMFLDLNGGWLVKVLILGMIYMAYRGPKKHRGRPRLD